MQGTHDPGELCKYGYNSQAKGEWLNQILTLETNKQKQKACVLFIFRYPIHSVELIRQYIQISYWLSWIMLTSLISLTTQMILLIPIRHQYFLLLNSLKKIPYSNFQHLVVELVLDFTLSFSYQDQKIVTLSCFR